MACFDHHRAEITVMQFTGHPLLVHQFMTVPWDFNPVPYCQPSSPMPMEYALLPSLEWHVWPGRRSIYYNCAKYELLVLISEVLQFQHFATSIAHIVTSCHSQTQHLSHLLNMLCWHKHHYSLSKLRNKPNHAFCKNTSYYCDQIYRCIKKLQSFWEAG